MDKKAILKQITDMEDIFSKALEEDRELTKSEMIDARFLLGCLKYLVNKTIKEKE